MQRRSLWIAGGATLLVLALGGIGAQKMAGPRLDAYQVVAQPLVQTVVATGRVTAPARVQVGSPITGVVLQRHVREGDRVRPGDVLAVLRADDLQAQVRQARAALTELQQSTRPQAQRAAQQTQQQWQQARRELERRRLLASQQAISHEALEQAIEAETLARLAAEQAQLQAHALQPGQSQEASAQARLASAQAQLDKATIRAEVAGTVLTRHAEPGDLVLPGQVLFEMAGDGTTEVLVALDEKNLEVLALGQSARCIADAYPRQPFAAELDFIAPSIDPQRGTVEVRLAVAAVAAQVTKVAAAVQGNVALRGGRGRGHWCRHRCRHWRRHWLTHWPPGAGRSGRSAQTCRRGLCPARGAVCRRPRWCVCLAGLAGCAP